MQQLLWHRIPAAGGAGHQQAADLLGAGAAPGLAGLDHLAAVAAQPCGQAALLRRLAGTLPAFQRDEAAALGHAHDSRLLSKSHSSRGALALRLSSRPSEQREREPGSIDGPGAGPSPRIFDWGPGKSAKDNKDRKSVVEGKRGSVRVDR